MNIYINDTPTAIQTPQLTDIISNHCNGIRPGIAVAINQRVIPRSQWDTTTVTAGDHLDILTAVQGG
ncbi:sulfur carrier protein ThiS [Corynebacterium diphtheriae]|uniref:sulfur carrier protein ThiS n=1 Tax=Corynebacterium diphtheriae TaxID=1717 RepID=UPI0013CB1964|nr:thiamine biosynthesis protein ThiS [Corynebacterium diphtheriae]CAB0717247.1 thiamine biosynthesis protein ThiS [Corynebacterium diphtheriae]